MESATLRNATLKFFTVAFYGLKVFDCKTLQVHVTRCECRSTGTPSIRDGMQRSENARENSVLNYESPALTAELQARVVSKSNHANR